MVRMD